MSLTEAGVDMAPASSKESRVSRVAILSCGRSLQRSNPPLGDYDSVLGVNYAVESFPADWWVWGDVKPFITWKPVSSPSGVFTSDGEWERLCGLHPERAASLVDGRSLLTWQAVTIPEFINEKWRVYTVTAALALAWHIGAREIDVYGHDMSGTVDCRGADKPSIRQPKRWEQERAIWNLLAARLERDGIAVRRVAA